MTREQSILSGHEVSIVRAPLPERRAISVGENLEGETLVENTLEVSESNEFAEKSQHILALILKGLEDPTVGNEYIPNSPTIKQLMHALTKPLDIPPHAKVGRYCAIFLSTAISLYLPFSNVAELLLLRPAINFTLYEGLMYPYSTDQLKKIVSLISANRHAQNIQHPTLSGSTLGKFYLAQVKSQEAIARSKSDSEPKEQSKSDEELLASSYFSLVMAYTREHGSELIALHKIDLDLMGGEKDTLTSQEVAHVLHTIRFLKQLRLEESFQTLSGENPGKSSGEIFQELQHYNAKRKDKQQRTALANGTIMGNKEIIDLVLQPFLTRMVIFLPASSIIYATALHLVTTLAENVGLFAFLGSINFPVALLTLFATAIVSSLTFRGISKVFRAVEQTYQQVQFGAKLREDLLGLLAPEELDTLGVTHAALLAEASTDTLSESQETTGAPAVTN